MKIVRNFAAVAAAASLFAGALGLPALAEDVSLKIAGQHPVDHYGTQALEQIKKELEAAWVGIEVSCSRLASWVMARKCLATSRAA